MNAFLITCMQNRTILHRVKHEVGVDVDITLDDIDDITASSSDPRFPPSNIFRSPAVAKGPRCVVVTVARKSLFVYCSIP